MNSLKFYKSWQAIPHYYEKLDNEKERKLV